MHCFSASLAIFVITFVLEVQTVFAHTSPLTRQAAPDLPVRDIWQFENGTWIENLAVRANGQLLVTSINNPDLYQIDPFKKNDPILVARLPQLTSLVGIAEIQPEIFAVIAGNISLKTFKTTPGSFQIWKIDLSSWAGSANSSVSPTISKVTNVPEAGFLNGLTALDSTSQIVLAADLTLGLVWRIDCKTGQYYVILEDPLLSPPSGGAVPYGVDGVHVRNGTLYFTNPGKEIFGRVPLTPLATAAGPYENITSIGAGDDFTFDAAGNAFIAGQNEIQMVSTSSVRSVVAGGLNSSALAGSTAAAFGRTASDNSTLYVTTSGGLASPINGTFVEGGFLAAVDLGQLGY